MTLLVPFIALLFVIPLPVILFVYPITDRKARYSTFVLLFWSKKYVHVQIENKRLKFVNGIR